ncbi:hypothetical protein ABZ477_14095 [Microbacterium sp. NPDC019599]|uniref:PadR family transcriptional regulator n=1 Tax=Microbacterium sp. NPDC019599 TaxID=3154690 RepID=UPI00340A1FBD
MHHFILGMLLLGPLSLYDLHKQFSLGPSLFYSASFGSIQRALRLLVDAGHVTVAGDPDGRRGRKLHTITDSGRETWAAWMRAPVDGSDAETVMLAKVFLLGFVPEPDERRAIVDTLLARVRGDLAVLRDAGRGLDAQEIPAEAADLFRYQRATLDYGIRAHELAEEWLIALR